MNQETKDQREIMACQDQEEHQEHQEKQEKMVPEGILVTLDQGVSPVLLDQREMMEDLVLATLDQEDLRVIEERRATGDLAVGEVTVAKRVNLEIKELLERLASQDLAVNLDLGDQEASLDVMEIPALKEILVSLNVTS